MLTYITFYLRVEGLTPCIPWSPGNKVSSLFLSPGKGVVVILTIAKMPRFSGNNFLRVCDTFYFFLLIGREVNAVMFYSSKYRNSCIWPKPMVK